MICIIPEEFAADRIRISGQAGREWIEGLPGLIERLCIRWSLVPGGVPTHGHLGLVVPVKRLDGERCALKVSWIDESNENEARALSTWNGKGAVQLLASLSESGALLLEWLDSKASLKRQDLATGIQVTGHLIKRLAVPGADSLPSLRRSAETIAADMADRWERYGQPMPKAWIDEAVATARGLGPTAGTLLVNYDLHFENVLAGRREPWLAIDPKVVRGDPEYGIAQVFWTELERIEFAGGLNYWFSALAESAALDMQRARSWTLFRCLDYWLWGLSIGLTEDPMRCQFICEWIVNEGVRRRSM
jgi:streptomycin 6-kinase